MDLKIKNVLGIVVIIVLLALSGAAWKYAAAYERSSQPWSFRTFTVSGQGEVVGIPDVAELTLTVSTEGGKDLAALQKENSDKMNAVIALVKSKGVEDKDVTTKWYNVEPRYSYCVVSTLERGEICPPPAISGYSIKQSLQVKVRKFEVIGDILSEAVTAGANEVSGPVFRIDDHETLRAQAREKAIAQAKGKAEQLAKSAGFKVGKLLSIDEGGGYYPPMPYYSEGMGGDTMGKALSAPAAPAIEPGSQDVNVTLNLVFQMK